MAHGIGDAVRMRPGSEIAPLLAEAAELTGRVGDAWTDERGERVSVHYPAVQLYCGDFAASEFVPDSRPDAAPF